MQRVWSLLSLFWLFPTNFLQGSDLPVSHFSFFTHHQEAQLFLLRTSLQCSGLVPNRCHPHNLPGVCPLGGFPGSSGSPRFNGACWKGVNQRPTPPFPLVSPAVLLVSDFTPSLTAETTQQKSRLITSAHKGQTRVAITWEPGSLKEHHADRQGSQREHTNACTQTHRDMCLQRTHT